MKICAGPPARVLVFNGQPVHQITAGFNGIALERLAVSQKENVLGDAIAPDCSDGGVPCGSTNKVMLCAGRVLLNVPPLKDRSLNRLMTPAEVSCHTCTLPEENWPA